MATSAQQQDASSSEGSCLSEYDILNFPPEVDWSTTAVLRCDPAGVPFSEGDILSAIFNVIRRDMVFNVGPTAVSHVFTVCMKSQYETNVFCKRAAEQKLKVKGRPCVVEPVPTACVDLCIRGIPLEVDSSGIVEVLKPYGTVVRSESLKSRHRGWFHVYTNVRKFTLSLRSGVSIDDLPYGIYVKGMFGSVLVPERNPKCKECYYRGHNSDVCEYEGCPFDYRKPAATGQQ